MSTVARVVLVAVLALSAASCRHRVVVVEHDVAYNEGPREEVVVGEAAPASRVEVIPVAPSVNHVWVAGYWSWRGGSWVWVSGRHVLRPRVGVVWVAGHWARHPRGWVWVHGCWR
jgi:hypothetical protein